VRFALVAFVLFEKGSGDRVQLPLDGVLNTTLRVLEQSRSGRIARSFMLPSCRAAPTASGAPRRTGRATLVVRRRVRSLS
jgi:hypothetical protein